MKDLQDLCKSEFRAAASFRTSPSGCGLCPSLYCLPAQISNLISHSPHCHPSLHSSLLFSSNNPNSKVYSSPKLLHLKLPLPEILSLWALLAGLLLSAQVRFPWPLIWKSQQTPVTFNLTTLLIFLLCTYHCVNDIASWLTCVVKAWILSQPFFFCP